ncbi:Uncharacterized protein FWK35_00017974 [Aphis craccivora]|uniref:SWIM-type domain-containing protein n=1 Tax=Aphis craccivora TaxID=307492 RepID=A0A6G0YJ31_APHCR|nr:Uncharacterized protein FWK35_00017974 [Aphis craccivora]
MSFHELNIVSDEDLSTDVLHLKILANSQINPRSRQIYYLHDEWRKLHFGNRTDKSIYNVLKERKAKYEINGNEMLIDKDKKIVAILTPIMRRSHDNDFMKDIVFVDSSGSCDQTNTIGGIPLGIVLHTGQSTNNYLSAFEFLKKLIVSNGFGGKGELNICMTDDSLAERNALQTCFPKSTLLLCTFHVLQAVWRWLWDSKHNINVEHRKYLINLLRKILYSSNEHECVKAMDTLISDNISKKYINYIRYIEKLWQRRTEWCLCYRSKLSIRGQGAAFCKHLCAVHEMFSNISISPTLSTTDRINLAKIALGHLTKDDEQFFNNMTLPTTIFGSLNNEVHVKIFNADKSCGRPIENIISNKTLDINIEQKYEAEAERLKDNLNKVLNLVTTNKDYSMINILKKTNNKLQKVRNSAQLAALLVNLGKQSTNKNIGVQPTSIARRKNRN